ncbi:hypothetical protein C7C46_00825 [Streptomyces tateyamensis]|uniref:Spore-associated protein n=1 Tax=Streptomyces tateyamensis TaxID=565073 RepID=A0A2V4PAP7_9ACTN|nr:hypothetical protein [Streptomyces tateyamensis]PYC88226.1 hypothetical protein C7C46_00825 [Streptomyces tateyamensis]
MLNRTVRPCLTRSALAAAAVLALAGAVAPAASAETAAGHGPSAAGSFTFAGHDARTGAATAVTCTPNVNAPFRYYGGPFGGGVEGLAGLTCTQPMYEIQTVVALYRGTTQVGFNTHTIYSTTTGSADTEAPLVAGQYTTYAQYTVIQTYGGASTTSPVYQSSTVTLP